MNKIIEKLDSWKEIFIANLPNIAIATLVMIIAYFASGAIKYLR